MDTSTQIIERLRQSPFWTARTKIGGGYVNNITCPECGVAKGFVYERTPSAILCNRMNHCGASTSTKELFPDIWTDIEKKFPPIPDDRDQPARAYLSMRGLSTSLKGLNFEYLKNIRKSNRGAVMFFVGPNHGVRVCNGRVISPKPGMDKSHNIGKTGGLFWEHSGHEYDLTEEVFVTEGIIDALSFFEIGKQAIAVLSTNSDPSKIDLSKFKKITFAFDLDSAGQGCLKKWKAKYPKAGAILPIRGDWNDLLTGMGREKAGSYFKEKRMDFECQGKLALAETGDRYAQIYNDHYGRAPGLFKFDRCYYHSKKTKSKEGDILTTQVVSDFTLKVHHFQLNNENKDRPVNEFHIVVKPKKGRPVAFTMSGKEIASPQGVTETFLSRARCSWSGDSTAHKALIKKIVSSDAPVARQLQIMGYDKESDCHVFQDFLIKPDGQSFAISKDGFFELGRRSFIRPFANPIIIKPTKGFSLDGIYNLLNTAWPDRAAAAIAWMAAGWFVSLIKSTLGFFPFLSFYKDTQVGKSHLAKFLNAMQCLNEEGLPMNKVNTSKGEIRKIAQRSGLFIALLEGNEKETAKFDFDSILNLYGDNILQLRAKTTNDLQLIEVPFLSSFLFVQNREPFITKAQKERIISLPFGIEMITGSTTNAHEKLSAIPGSEYACFIQEILKHRQRIKSEWFGLYTTEKQKLIKVTKNARISENHAIILAFHKLVTGILNIGYDLRPYVEKIAAQKCWECDLRENSVADYFFDIVLGSNRSEFALCVDLRKEKNDLYIHLPGICDRIKERHVGYNVPTRELQAALCQHPAYKRNNFTHRFKFDPNNGDQPTERPQKAWLFDWMKIKGQP